MKTYNGWANYATWRVNLEIFDGMHFDEKVDAKMLKDLAEEIIFDNGEATNLCIGYALSFLMDVNWHEIAQSINEEFNL